MIYCEVCKSHLEDKHSFGCIHFPQVKQIEGEVIVRSNKYKYKGVEVLTTETHKGVVVFLKDWVCKLPAQIGTEISIVEGGSVGEGDDTDKALLDLRNNIRKLLDINIKYDNYKNSLTKYLRFKDVSFIVEFSANLFMLVLYAYGAINSSAVSSISSFFLIHGVVCIKLLEKRYIYNSRNAYNCSDKEEKIILDDLVPAFVKRPSSMNHPEISQIIL